MYILLVVLPLASGGVTPYSLAFQKILTGLLLILYGIKKISQHQASYSQTGHRTALFRFPSALTLASGGLFIIMLFHIMPLPRGILRILSPMSVELYAEAAAITKTPLRSWFPLSPALQTTITEYLTLFSYGALFFLCLHTFRTPRRILRFMHVILAMGFLQAFYGLLRFVSDTASQTFTWAHGSFVNKNHFAGYLELTIPLAIASLLIHFEKRKTGHVQTLEEKYMKSLLHLFALFLMICAIFLSGSRGGLISFSIGVLGFATLAVTRRLIKRWLAIMLLGLGLALGVFMAINPAILQQQTTHFIEFDRSLQVRQEIWKSAWRIFQDFPVFGSGLGTYSHLSRRYKTFLGTMHFRYAEGDYVQLLAETGIFGSILALGTGFSIISRILAAWRRQESRQALAITIGGLSAMMSIAIHSAVDFNLHIPSNMLLFCAIAAITYNSAHLRKHIPSSVKTPTHITDAATARSRVRKRAIRKASARHQPILWAMVVGVLILVAYVVMLLAAFMRYQSGMANIPKDMATLDPSQHAQILSDLRQAARYAPLDAEYASALGTYMYDVVTKTDSLANPPLMTDGFTETEKWMIQAVLDDPANPWYYYSLGRLHYSRGDCHHWQKFHPNDDWDACPVTRYFRAALENAPKHPFFREAFGRWYGFYDQERARQHMRDLLAHDDPDAPIDLGGQQFARFLYDLHMDFESTQIVEKAWPSPSKEPSSQCQSEIIAHAPDSPRVEIGSDDGTAEWKTPLLTGTDRVKKTLCLPEDIGLYRKVSLLIFANRGSTGEMILTVGINAEIREVPGYALPQSPAWYEIPLEMSLLEEHPAIQVYLRARGVNSPEHAPIIWGDAHSPRRDSEYNFRRTDDLSSEAGPQTGEYMIRLILER